MPSTTFADVAVVGAGPGGSTAAAYLAEAGHDVVLIDKDSFPREKVCGDGLTPRVIKELRHLGLHAEADGEPDGWAVQTGLRVHGGDDTVLELPWPQLDDWPAHGATCTRDVFDERLVRHAESRGAELWEQTTVTGPVWREGEGGRVAGVRWRDADDREGIVRAPVVIAADGASSGLGKHLGLHRREDRPMAVAIRTYYTSPRADDPWISSFLNLRGSDGDLLSGYGWIFPLDDGRLNVGLGLLDTADAFGKVSYRKLLESWTEGLGPAWGTTPEARSGSVRSGPIPMGFNRTPLHSRGVMLVGDAGGMVNPFNGEGISYAMEAARLAAEVADEAIARRSTVVLDRYDHELRQRLGGYFRLGGWFAEMVGHPTVMHVCTTYGLPRRGLMELVLKLMAQLSDRKPSDAKDAVVNAMQRLAPIV